MVASAIFALAVVHAVPAAVAPPPPRVEEVLHPRNQARFAFRLEGRDEKEGAAAWIEAARGALVVSRLEVSPPGPRPVTIETVYARDDRLGFWLPREMREAYGSRWPSAGDERVEALARYSAWRRAQVEVQVILPVR